MENIEHLRRLREFELECALQSFPDPTRGDVACSVLEIGAGTGHQARMLADRGYAVIAVDVASSSYRAQRVFPIREFDGITIPVATASVSVVFSSNVLEHISGIDPFLDEINRVLEHNGIIIHILPTPAWRFWTILGHYGWLAKRLYASLVRRDHGGSTGAPPVGIPSFRRRLIGALFPLRHGERGSTVTEMYYYSQRWWRRKFTTHCCQVLASYPCGLFYTGANVLGDCLPIAWRRRMSQWLGSASRIYVLHCDDK